MEKVLGGPEGVVTVLVQQSTSESTLFLLFVFNKGWVRDHDGAGGLYGKNFNFGDLE